MGTDYELDTPWGQILPQEAPAAVKQGWHSTEGSSEPPAQHAERGIAGALLGADLPSSDESDFSFRCG